MTRQKLVHPIEFSRMYRSHIVRLLAAAVGCLFLPSPTSADDWPQWMGPTRDGVLHESGLVDTIPDAGLNVKWRVPVQGGYSGPAVANGRVFVTDYVKQGGESFNDPGKRAELEGKERVLCFDAETGKEIWKHEYDCKYSISYPVGPRCTPTVDGDHVYVLGAEGDLICLAVENGSVVWQRSFKNDLGAPVPIWGHSAHPLVHGENLICLVGGEGAAVVAFNKLTGVEVWKSLSVPDIGYCPPSVIRAAGVEQLLIWHPKALVSLNPEDGSQYWEEPIEPQYGMSITQPQRDGDLLYVSGIGAQSLMLKIASDKPGAEELWVGEPKNSVYCANSTPLLVDGVIYGVDCQVGFMVAADAKDGSRFWESYEPTTRGTRRASHGTAFITLSGDKFFLFSETGDIVIADIDSKQYSERGRFHVLDPTSECFGRSVVWSHPAYANKKLYARNDKELVCVSLDSSDY